MIALIRPDAWNFPLFLHVFGAIVLFGGLAASVIFSVAADRFPLNATLSRTLAFWTMLIVVWPGYVFMRAAAQWIYDKENLDPDFPTWVAFGVFVADGGILVLLVLTGLAWYARRRSGAGDWFIGIASLYLIALGVAWWAMSAKPGA
jgi:hypothetical protein